jgi:hypothetical protein
MVLFGTGLLAAPENRIEQRIGDDVPHIPLVSNRLAVGSLEK